MTRKGRDDRSAFFEQEDGYVIQRFFVDAHDVVELYVPCRLAQHLAREGERFIKQGLERAREAKHPVDERHTEERARQEQTQQNRPVDGAIDPKKLERSARAHVPHALEVMPYQVLVDVEKVAARLRDLRAGLQGDRDQAAREEKALSRALERGRYRSIVRIPTWRDALENLACELPGFRAAIVLVRNALAVAELTASPPVIPPLLLVGSPGVGKSYFCRRLAEVLGLEMRWIGMDQPSAGSQLRGSDRAWGNSIHGFLFEALALGQTANPLFVLDEIDKSGRSLYGREVDPLAQLYSALERETARRISDISLDVELDASRVMYLATANGIRGLDAALLSRFEVVTVDFPSELERKASAALIVAKTLEEMAMHQQISLTPGAVAILALCSPRIIQRTVERAVGAALAIGRKKVRAEDIEETLGLTPSALKVSDTRRH